MICRLPWKMCSCMDESAYVVALNHKKSKRRSQVTDDARPMTRYHRRCHSSTAPLPSEDRTARGPPFSISLADSGCSCSTVLARPMRLSPTSIPAKTESTGCFSHRFGRGGDSISNDRIGRVNPDRQPRNPNVDWRHLPTRPPFVYICLFLAKKSSRDERYSWNI